jgi:DNA-binding XRE family transcriptional regulator
LTGAEYRTLRELCGLTQWQAADIHGVSLRTVQHWEEERNGIAVQFGSQMRSLNGQIDEWVRLCVEMARSREPPSSGGGASVKIARYRSEDAYEGSDYDARGLPFSCHCALVGRKLIALEQAGYTVSVEFIGKPS